MHRLGCEGARRPEFEKPAAREEVTIMVSSRNVTSPGQWTRARFRDKLSWLLRDIVRTASGQLRGSTRSSYYRTKVGVYWTRDRRGQWVLHVPVSLR